MRIFSDETTQSSTFFGSLSVNNPTMVQQNWLKIGRVGKPYGLRGAFYISGRAEPFPPRCRMVALGESPELAPQIEIRSIQAIGGREVLYLEGYSDRTAIEKFVNQMIWVQSAEVRAQLRTDEYFWDDLIGKPVEDIDGAPLGTVVAVANHGASDVIDLEDSLGRTLSLPLVASYFDMDFTADSSSLRLRVSADLFSDLWETLPT
jgi:16S rRNA processing protein RimM